MRETQNHRPKGYAALGRSTSLKPPALPEVADSQVAVKVLPCPSSLSGMATGTGLASSLLGQLGKAFWWISGLHSGASTETLLARLWNKKWLI